MAIWGNDPARKEKIGGISGLECNVLLFVCFSIRECFPYSLQMALLLRFMMDNTQTPNSRVKVAVLNFLTALVRDMQPQDLTAITLQTGPPGIFFFCLFIPSKCVNDYRNDPLKSERFH